VSVPPTTADGTGDAPLALGIDLGTGSVKASTIDAAGEVVGHGSATYALRRSHDGAAETDPSDWWQATVAAVRVAVGGDANRIVGIGISGQMHGVVLTDGEGAALRPAMLWPDSRASVEVEAFRRLPPDLKASLANPIAPGMAGPLLLWLKQHEPAAYEHASVALQPKDWLRLQLTGVIAAEPSDASATLLYDVASDHWNWEVVASLGLRESLLAPLIPSVARAGELLRSPAEELGLPPGLPVAAGAADTAAALLGSGVNEPGSAQLSIGSGAQFVAVTDRPTLEGVVRTQTYRMALDRGWYVMAAMHNGGLALERVLEWLNITWDEAYELIPQSPRGSNGILFLPYVTGERTPYLDSDLRAEWLNLSHATQRADLIRAALEGVALAIKSGFTALRDANHEVDSVVLTGGGTGREIWRQMLSDVLGLELRASSELNPSARGAAILGAGVGGIDLSPGDRAGTDTEFVTPDAAAVADYERLHVRFERAVRAQQEGRLVK